jgi:acetylornithine aminotransferase/acetylornithine/N-succinyldiaminopimelate aminotransferase
MTTATDVQAIESRHIVQVYRRQPVVFVRGEGVHLFDSDGRKYLDLVSGVGVASLGHADPALADAIADQARTLLHCSNLYFHPLQGAVAERLAAMSGLPRAFFCNSGAEAVETCLKFAKRYWHTHGDHLRTGIVALKNSFHGRTIGAVAATWDPHYRTPFEPLMPGVTFVPAGDAAALRAAVDSSTAAIILEAIQGEGGVRPISPAFAAAVTDIQARTGTLVIADEVQCGLGRTGHDFHFRTLGLKPDLVSVGKALGAGVPVGAALATEAVASAISFGDHGSTYGGNLLACRAALFFLDRLQSGLIDHVARVGAHLERALRHLAARHAVIREVRGAGLMWGLDLTVDAAPIVDAARQRFLLVNRTSGTVVRLLPPLVITEAQLDDAIGILDAVLAEVSVQEVRA